MRMLRWMCCHTIKDRIHNDHIREKVEIISIMEKMVENRLGGLSMFKEEN